MMTSGNRVIIQTQETVSIQLSRKSLFRQINHLQSIPPVLKKQDKDQADYYQASANCLCEGQWIAIVDSLLLTEIKARRTLEVLVLYVEIESLFVDNIVAIAPRVQMDTPRQKYTLDTNGHQAYFRQRDLRYRCDRVLQSLASIRADCTPLLNVTATQEATCDPNSSWGLARRIAKYMIEAMFNRSERASVQS